MRLQLTAERCPKKCERVNVIRINIYQNGHLFCTTKDGRLCLECGYRWRVAYGVQRSAV